MSRRGSNVGMRMPLFQIKVADFSNRRYRTTVMNGENGRRKLDVPIKAPCRTLVERFKDGKAAMRWASRFGTVLSCFKVDVSPYLINIEHLNLAPTFKVEVADTDYVLNKALELSRPRKRSTGENIAVEGIDKDDDL